MFDQLKDNDSNLRTSLIQEKIKNKNKREMVLKNVATQVFCFLLFKSLGRLNRRIKESRLERGFREWRTCWGSLRTVSDRQHPWKTRICHPCSGRVETGGSQGLTGKPVYTKRWTPGPVQDPSHKATEESDRGSHLPSASGPHSHRRQVHVRMCVHIHTAP